MIVCGIFIDIVSVYLQKSVIILLGHFLIYFIILMFISLLSPLFLCDKVYLFIFGYLLFS